MDINPNSVNICRLRLWIELLKNACYTQASGYTELETLPNIDINIKCGNSLLSRYSTGNDIKDTIRDTDDSIAEYLRYVSEYKNAHSKDEREYFRHLIAGVKNSLRATLSEQSEANHNLWQAKNALTALTAQNELISTETVAQKKEKEKKIVAAQKKLADAEAAWDELENNAVYANALEWRFEFPEILDVDGNFMGFDVVIGNPPYFVYEGNHKSEISILRKQQDLDVAFGGKLNAYKLFMAKGLKSLVKEKGFLSFIFQNSFLADSQAAAIRKYVLDNSQIICIDSFPERDSKKKRVFENVKMSVCITLLQKTNTNETFILNIWDSKDKASGLTTNYTATDIKSINPDDYVIPRIKSDYKTLVIKIKTLPNCSFVTCWQGELNMTVHRPYFTQNKDFPKILKGASIQRYYYTEDMSQGIVEHVNEKKYLTDFPNSEKANHHNYERIAMQGMSGANDKIRLISTIIPKGIYLAHSCNYIIPTDNFSLLFLLGILNSKFANWYFKLFSTNSNVNSYEIENIPIPTATPEQQQEIVALVEKILAAKASDHNADTSEWEKQIDLLVYKLYGLTFEEAKVIDPELTEDDFDGAE